MWIIMLVMMVFTRTRLDENSQLPAYQSVPEGSASAGTKQQVVFLEEETAAAQSVATQPAAAQPAAAQPAAAQPGGAEIASTEQLGAEIAAAQQRAGPSKRRGPNINHTVSSTLYNFPKGTKIPLTMDKETKTFVGTLATHFATECGIVIRNVSPMKFHTWDAKEVKTLVYEKLEESFEWLWADNVLMEYWKRAGGVLSKHWKKNGGKTNPLVARSNMKPGCRSEEDWNHLCNYWELEKTRKYSDKMEANRAKQVNISRGGSRSISNHVFQMPWDSVPNMQTIYTPKVVQMKSTKRPNRQELVANITHQVMRAPATNIKAKATAGQPGPGNIRQSWGHSKQGSGHYKPKHPSAKQQSAHPTPNIAEPPPGNLP
ncbi:hypothetical protein R6Q59_010352 [Mikania micrantha]